MYVCVYYVLFYIALQLTPGSTVVMHLVMREQLPEPTNQGKMMTFVFSTVTDCNLCFFNVSLILVDGWPQTMSS